MTTPLLRKGLKITHLRLVAALAETGQISAAARDLSISQPAASRLAAEAEAIAGVPLYRRTGRGVELTPAGAAFAARCRRAIREMEDAGRELAERAAGRTGSVTIGAVTGPAIEHVLPVVETARRTLPGVRIAIEVGTSDVLCPMLLDGRLDFALARIPVSNAGERSAEAGRLLQSEPVGPEPVSLVVRRHHPLMRVHPLRVEDLMDHDWVLPFEGAILRTTVERALVARGLGLPARVLTTSSFLLTLAMIRQSNAIAPLASAVADAFAASGDDRVPVAVLPFDLGIEVEAYGLVTRTDQMLTPAAQAVFEILRTRLALARRNTPV